MNKDLLDAIKLLELAAKAIHAAAEKIAKQPNLKIVEKKDEKT